MAQKEITAFGRRLEAAIREKEMTDAELAEKLKMHQPQLFSLKRSKNPQRRTLQKLSKVFKKPLDFWTDESGVVAQTNSPAPAPKGSLISSEALTMKAKFYFVIEVDGHQVSKILLQNN